MLPNDDYPDDDSFERALDEYRERSRCPDDFADLPTEVQCDIIERVPNPSGQRPVERIAPSRLAHNPVAG
jgi:hypothetical protein